MGIHQMLMVAGGGGPPIVNMGDIANSLRLRGTQTLTRTMGSGNAGKWAFSTWVKRGRLSGDPAWLGNATVNAGANFYAGFTASNQIIVSYNNSFVVLVSNAVFLDPSAWMHLELVWDSANAIANQRCRLFVNGVELTSFATDNRATLTSAYTTTWNTAILHYLYGSANAALNMEGYEARTAFVDGEALPASSFGEFNSVGQWVSKSQSAVKAVVDAGGANSFMLEFDNTSSLVNLGLDKSVKGNNWTLNNVSITAGTTYDAMVDTPSNNFATLNPLNPHNVSGGASVLGSGSLQLNSASVVNAYGAVGATICPSSGKWYWEITCGVNNAGLYAGATKPNTGVALSTTNIYFRGLPASSDIWRNSAQVQGPFGAFTAGAILGVALDLDAKTMQFKLNGADIGVPLTGLAAGEWMPWTQAQTSAAVAGSALNINFGQRPFTYTPPVGFKALSTANLDAAGTVTVSGSFTGNANADGPFIWMNGVPTTLTINGNAVTFGTHADKTAGGFKLRTALAAYNAAGNNNWTATIVSNSNNLFKYQTAKANP